ncbi:MAG: transposase [Chloroflexi bacterium]|nr:transposase [Chloroflexota bacterium]
MAYRKVATNCIVRVIPLRNLSKYQEDQCRSLREEAGRCWTDMLQLHIMSRSGKWLSSVDLGKIFKGQYRLHSQSIQTLAQKLEANADMASELRKTDPGARYPYHPKKYQTVTWKELAIHWTGDGKLLLSNGKSTPALVLPMSNEYLDVDLCRVELTWRADHYEVCLTIDTGLVSPPLKENGQIAGVDLGEINIAAVCTESGDALVVSGRALRSVKQIRNKRHAIYTSLISRCKPGSKRQRRLLKSKARSSAKLERQQRDILHKASRQVIEFCRVNNVKAIAVGDVRDIQQKVDLGAKTNQKISQWTHGQYIRYLTYKARKYGMQVEQILEDYSTRTCSFCGYVVKYALRGRVYSCPGCGTIVNRDVNGASNICSRARHGKYSNVHAQTIKYLRPLRRSRAFDTGQSCLF